MTRLLCTFLPQEWVGGHRLSVQRDAASETSGKSPIDEAFVGGDDQRQPRRTFLDYRLEPHSYEVRSIDHAGGAGVVREWGGPFEVEYRRSRSRRRH